MSNTETSSRYDDHRDLVLKQPGGNLRTSVAGHFSGHMPLWCFTDVRPAIVLLIIIAAKKVGHDTIRSTTRSKLIV
ncbi:hypothetical protein KCU85_g1, partial [Aureobasidium melanogenum]